MIRSIASCAACVLLLAASGCSSGSSSPPPPPPPTVVEVPIPPSGGSLELKEPEGQIAVALTVPEGVFTETQTVSVTRTTPPESLPAGAKSSLVVFEPRIELPASPQGVQPKVALKVPPGTLPGSATIYWERWALANTYDPLPTAMETKDGVVYAVAEISRLSSGFVGLHCAVDAACTPATECRDGAWGCATGRPVCEERGPSPDGVACGKPAGAGVCKAGACVTDPVIRSFTASQAMVERGTAVVLEWSVSNVDSLSIDPEVGLATGTTATVWPSSTTTYTLTATNAAGSTTAQVTVTVVPPIRIAFTAEPATIARGASSTLRWNVTGADAITIDQGIGAVTGTSWAVSPAATTTYRLTATNALLTATADVTVTVIDPPIMSAFDATPSVVTPGGAATLTWTISGADTLSIDNGVGTVTGTSVTVNPSVTTTYTLTATNAVATRTAQVTVTVVPPVRILAFTATPATIAPGDSAVLSWNVANADLLSIDGGIGTVTGLSRTVSPTTTTTYRLTATNAVSSATAEVTVTVTARPVIAEFTAGPPAVLSGGASTLRWSVTGATTLSIDQGIGTVTGTSRVVNPTTTTTYTLTATNAAGPSTAQVTVTVVPPVVISSFTADPAAVQSGGASTLRWTVTGATALSIDQGIGTVTGTSRVVNPAATTTYTLTATNAASSATASVTVTVMAPPEFVAFTADPAVIVPGGASTLRWTVIGATTLSIDNGIGTVWGTSRVVNPTTTTTYTLTATNAVGSSSRQVTVTVVPRVAIRSFTASPTAVQPGGMTTLSWDVSGADTLSIDNGVGAVTGTSWTVWPVATTAYTLTAANAASSATATVTVTVMAPPVISSFTADPSAVLSGGASTLRWTVIGATTLSIDNAIGAVTGTSRVVNPTTTTTYTLTATNAVGSVTRQVTVNVVPPVVISSFTADPAAVQSGGASTLRWTVTGATALSIDNGIGTVTGTSRVVNPTATTTYTLTATNAASSATATATVTVMAPPVISAFTADPSAVVPGGASTLRWTVAGATTLSLDNGIGTVTGTALAVNPSVTTTYTLTATNAVGSSSRQVTVTVVPRVVIRSFTASPTAVQPGGMTTLSWDVSGADTLSIDNGVGAVTGTSWTVWPVGTTTYTLTAANAASSAAASVTVTVMAAPVISAFTADPSAVLSGGASTLRWTVTGATTLSIDNGVGTVTGTSRVVNATTTTTYTLTATNAVGSATRQVTVTVVPQVVIGSFTADPSAVQSGGTSTLRWTVTGATTLSINQGIGTVTGTSRVVTPTATTTYTLTAMNAASSATATVTVTVMAPPVISAFTADPSAVVPGGASTLRWTVAGATTLSIDNGIGTVTGASRVVNPTLTTTYTLTASNAVGSTTRQVTVTVIPAVVINSFTASPPAVDLGGSSTLSWNVSNADTISIDNGIGVVTGTSVVVHPAVQGTTRYRLTASNAVSSTFAEVTVIMMESPIIFGFRADPSTVLAGGPSTLSWTVTPSGTTVSLDNGIGTVTGASRVVNPLVTTTYTLTAANAVGTATARTTVTVVPPVEIRSFTASPATIAPGAPSTLSWNVTGADTLSIDNGIGTVTGTSLVVRPSVTTTYTLTARNAAASRTASVRVAVTPGDVWVYKSPMPTGRMFPGCAVNAGRIHVIGGQSGSSTGLSTHEAYDPVNDRWESLPSLGVPRSYPAAGAVSGGVFVTGGMVGLDFSSPDPEQYVTTYAMSRLYDPASAAWSDRAPLPAARSEMATVTAGGMLYTLGGWSNRTRLANVEVYNPTANTWAPLRPLPVGRSGAVAAAVDLCTPGPPCRFIYVFGGYTGVYDRTVLRYDVSANTWSTVSPMPTGRHSPGIALLDGLIYVMGGWDGASVLNVVEVYDPFRDVWSTRAPMHTARQGLAAGALNGKVYVIGGWSPSGGYVGSVEEYTPPTVLLASE